MRRVALILAGALAAAVAARAAAQQAPAYPADVYPNSGFRLPLPKREDLDADAQKMYDRAVDPKGGTIAGLRGPGGIRLYSSKLATMGSGLNAYLRFEAGIDPHIREVAILTTARAFDSQFEWTAHEPVALKLGVPPATIDIVKHHKSLKTVPEPDRTVIEFGRELWDKKKVSSATYARALQQFGPKGLVNLVALIGDYASTAALLTAFDMQLHPGQQPLLPPK